MKSVAFLQQIDRKKDNKINDKMRHSNRSFSQLFKIRLVINDPRCKSPPVIYINKEIKEL